MPLRPQPELSEQDTHTGLRWLLIDGVCSQTMSVLTTGALLVAFALQLGASNAVIGLLAAIGPACQLLQLPSILVVDKVRLRKLLVVGQVLISRLFWVVIALVPFVVPEPLRMPVFLAALVGFFALASAAGTAFNSWMRDFVPQEGMGRYFARRMSWSIAVGAILSLGAGLAVDSARMWWPAEPTAPAAVAPSQPAPSAVAAAEVPADPGVEGAPADAAGMATQPHIGVYTVLFLIGTAAGLVGVTALSRIPEPRMAPPGDESLWGRLAAPLKDRNFRRLLMFLAAWNFAVNIPGPFFAVYMLKRLDLSMTLVVGFGVTSQMVNVLFLRIWGGLADRFSNKSVLSVSGAIFVFSFLIWPLTTMPDVWAGTYPLLIGFFLLSGVATAGIALCTGNIALKLAPRGEATAYLAVNALVSGAAATVAPILAGFLADWFDPLQVGLTLTLVRHDWAAWPSVLNLTGIDFLFLIGFVAGLYALHRLLAVREEGEVQEKVVVTELFAEMRRTGQAISNVPGMRQMTVFPFAAIRTTRLAARKVAEAIDLRPENVQGGSED